MFLLPDLIDLAAADAETLTRQHTPLQSSPTRPTGVTHSLHPHWTPAQSKLPIFTPHFSLGHTILPDTSPFFKNGSIHVSCTVSGHVTIRPSYRLTGSTKYPEHFGLTRMGGPLVASELSCAPLGRLSCNLSAGVMANNDIRLPIVPELEDELWDRDRWCPFAPLPVTGRACCCSCTDISRSGELAGLALNGDDRAEELWPWFLKASK